MKNLWSKEPVAILAAVQAIITLVVVFGVNVSPGQHGAIIAAAGAILALFARSQVTPNG